MRSSKQPPDCQRQIRPEVNVASTMGPGVLVDAAALGACALPGHQLIKGCHPSKLEIETERRRITGWRVLPESQHQSSFLPKKGITVEKDWELRRKPVKPTSPIASSRIPWLRELSKILLLPAFATIFVGPTAVTYNENDPVNIAKLLNAFAKRIAVFLQTGGVVEGRAISVRGFPS